MLSDSEVRCPGFFLIFSSVSVKDFQNVLRLGRVITIRHSVSFQRNLVHIPLFLLLVALKKYMPWGAIIKYGTHWGRRDSDWA